MGTEFKTKALVLHEMQIGDYDKRLILLTKEYGKLTVFAKGAKKSNSKFLSVSQLFCYGDYHLFKGRNSYNLNKAELIDSFHNIRKSIEGLSCGLYILEFLEYVSMENHNEENLLKLAIYTLKQIEKERIKLELIISIFEIKLLSLTGYLPWTQSCVICNSNEELISFSVKSGGAVCNNCIKDIGIYKMSEGTRYTIEYITKQPIDKLFNFTVEDYILSELQDISKALVKENIEKSFKALEFLNYTLL